MAEEVKVFAVPLKVPEGGNIIVGKSHFIKTVEDIYEAVVETNPNIRFGIAFNEASQKRLIRWDGNDEELIKLAVENAKAIGAGHTFVIALKEGWPINLLPRLKQVAEVVEIVAATANPIQAVVAESSQGRGLLGVIDGYPPLGVEGQEDIEERKAFLRKIGYKR